MAMSKRLSVFSRMRRATSYPSMPGRPRSKSTTSGFSDTATWRAAGAEPAVETSCPASRSSMARLSTVSWWSSRISRRRERPSGWFARHSSGLRSTSGTTGRRMMNSPPFGILCRRIQIRVGAEDHGTFVPFSQRNGASTVGAFRPDHNQGFEAVLRRQLAHPASWRNSVVPFRGPLETRHLPGRLENGGRAAHETARPWLV